MSAEHAFWIAFAIPCGLIAGIAAGLIAAEMIGINVSALFRGKDGDD